MKQSILRSAIIILLSISINNVVAQNNIEAKTAYEDKDVLNLEQQYNSQVSQKKDGRFDLYTYSDGSKVTLTMKGGNPYGLAVFDREGKPVPVMLPPMNKLLRNPMRLYFKDSSGNIHKFTVGSPKGLETFVGKS